MTLECRRYIRQQKRFRYFTVECEVLGYTKSGKVKVLVDGKARYVEKKRLKKD